MTLSATSPALRAPARSALAARLRALGRVALALTLTTVALTSLAIYLTYANHRREASARLVAVAQLQAERVGGWIDERMTEAAYITQNVQYAALYQHWQKAGNAESQERLLERLVEFRRSTAAHSILVLDERAGATLREAGQPREVAPPLRAMAVIALAAGQPMHTDVYYEPGTELPLRMDFIAPLASIDGRRPGSVVMRVDPERSIFPMLRNWPGPTQSGESVLWRREGDDAVAMTPLRTTPGSAGLLRFRVAEPQLVVARAMRGELGENDTIEGLDYAGTRVLGTARRVPSTEWLMVTKISMEEAYAQAFADSLWLAAGGALALLGLLAGAALLRERHELRLALVAREGEAQRRSTLQLLDALVDSSGDLIFATDLDQRYTLFNKAGLQVLGKSRDEVLGRTADAVMPAMQAARVMAVGAEVIRNGQQRTYEEDIETASGRIYYLATKGPLRDSTGKVIGTFGIARDVTQWRASQAAIKASEQRLRLFVEHAPAAIAMLDTQMRYIVVSRRWLRDYRIAERDLTGMSHYDLFPELPDHWRVIHQRALRGEVVRSEAEAFARADGSTDWVKWEVRPWRGGDGAIGGIVLLTELVTERRQAELALRESTALLQAVGDSMVDHMAVLDRAGNIVAVNAAWRRFGAANGIAGDGPQQAMAGNTDVGANYLQACSSGQTEGLEREQAAHGIREVLDGTRSLFTMDYACDAPEEKRWFQLSATPLLGGAGGAVVLHADITSRRQAEATVRANEALYRSMVSTLSEGVIIFGLDGAVQAANPSAQAILGLTEDALRARRGGVSQWQPVRRDGSPLPLDELPLARTLATGEATHDVLLGHPDAQSRIAWLLCNSEPVIDFATGQMTAVVVSFVDVTERQAAEEQLLKLSSAVQQSAASIIIIDTDGMIEYVNDAYLRKSGYAREDVIGRNPRLERAGGVPNPRYVQMWEALHRGDTWRGEFTNVRKNGEQYIELAVLAPIRRADGQVSHYLSIQEDITERKRIEAELEMHQHQLEDLVARRTGELEAANRELKRTVADLETFSYSLSHDLRSPLGVISGFAGLLQRQEGERLTDQGRHRLGRIIEGTRVMDTTIRDILACMHAERVALALAPVDLAALLQQALLILQAAYPDTEVVAGDLPVVQADAPMVRQILSNLLGNAFKFSARTPSPRVEIGLREDADGTREIFVRDNGAGFDPAQAAHLFTLFHRLHAQSEFEGTGVGLAIVKRMVERHGGCIRAVASPGEGADFSFTLWPADTKGNA